MALANMARVATATTGTGTMTLGAAVAGFLTFANAGITNGQTVSYAIEDGNNREVGRGVYSSTGPTLTRTVLRSTNSNAAINLSGTAEVFITALAEDFPAAASTTVAGLVELATDAEMVAGIATGVVPTVKQVADKVAGAAGAPKAVTSSLTEPFALATAATWTDTGLSVTITPKATTSRVLLSGNLSYSHSTAGQEIFFRLVRGATAIGVGTTTGIRIPSTVVGTSNISQNSVGFSFVDEPSTISATTYKVQMYVRNATGYLNRSSGDGNSIDFSRPVSTLTAVEVSP